MYKCLGGFATNQINLTKLESFSVKNTFEQANFCLDLEGHLEQPEVKKALEELEGIVEDLESGDLSLENSLKSFEKGIKLARQCQEQLSKAELQVQKLIEENGELKTTPLKDV